MEDQNGFNDSFYECHLNIDLQHTFIIDLVLLPCNFASIRTVVRVICNTVSGHRVLKFEIVTSVNN